MTMEYDHPYFPTKKEPEPWETEDPAELNREDICRGHPKTPADLQRLKLEKLQRNMDKLAPIPTAKKEWEPPKPPEFVRNVVGSSAGAGSGEYHIYRNLRRKEYARIEFRDKESKKEEADEKWMSKFDEHKKAAEERTAKKRAKRLKKKEKAKKAKSGVVKAKESSSEDEEEEEEEGEEAKEATKDADKPPSPAQSS